MEKGELKVLRRRKIVSCLYSFDFQNTTWTLLKYWRRIAELNWILWDQERFHRKVNGVFECQFYFWDLFYRSNLWQQPHVFWENGDDYVRLLEPSRADQKTGAPCVRDCRVRYTLKIPAIFSSIDGERLSSVVIKSERETKEQRGQWKQTNGMHWPMNTIFEKGNV